MRPEQYPVLTDEDEPLVTRLSVGLGDRQARVLAYLLARSAADAFADPPATLLSVRVGTDLGRSVAKEALAALTAAGLVAETTVPREGQGRPPTAWTPVADREETTERVFSTHATALLEQAAAVAGDAAQGTDDGRRDADERDVGTENAPEAGTVDGKPVTVSLNWRPNGLQAPLLAARANDAYADRGLDVSFAAETGSDAALATVREGEALAGLVGATTLVTARHEGATLVPLALLYQRALAMLYTTRETFGEPFERAAQLRGRTVGMPVGSEIGRLGRLFLEQAGVADDVTIVDVAGEEQGALLAGDVDAVTGSLADPQRLREDGATVDAVHVAERFPIYGPALVARRPALTARRDALRALLAGTMAGVARTRVDPAVARTAVAEAGGPPAERARRSFEAARSVGGGAEPVADHGWGWHRPADWERLRTVLDQVGLLR